MKRKELSSDNIADTIATLALAGRISEDLADILIELANRVSKLDQEPKTRHWIPVTERLPNKDRYIDFYKCLVAVSCTSHNDICDSFTAYFDGKHFYRHLYDKAIISGVKAWMPLPESYKVRSEDEI